MSFEIWQCSNASCRFRFPAEVGMQQAQRCPRCGQPTQVVGQVQENGEMGTAVPTPPPSSPPLAALLDNIRSIHNVGSMFRTADGAGLNHLYLCGITATPEHPKLAKAALGAHEAIPWSQWNNGVDTAVSLQAQGYTLWAIEATPQAEPLYEAEITLPGPTALIVGNEKAGVDPGLLTLCDRVFCLPMYGRKRSLNAAVAFGIAAYTIRARG